jgi:lipopolysaccharide assembly outer membrane protein LptD (OstA)
VNRDLLVLPGLFLLMSALPGLAQEQEAVAAQEQGPEEETTAAADLIRETLAEDIETASYYELAAWCRELGLEDAGTRQVLQQRLYAYYQIPGAAPPVEGGKKRLLEIKSAKETQYFTVEEIDEDYVLLLGDVLVELQEEEATHRIRAHRILLNQTENILTAEGGIEYTLIKGEEEEVFHGERLTFNVKNWEGVFFGGEMEAERTVGGQPIRFRFFGESISRLENNTVVMDRGRITSCDQTESPHYHIRARKIWILAPNEWAILHAVLYVGRVPVLYLPFFFHPGEEFFFHPAIGYRDREGNFVQTTTYLIGQKKRTANALSFLAATEESTVEYEREIRGLFLRDTGVKKSPSDENKFLKVMLDFYSRLGGFAGIQGNFPPKVDFRFGLGVSRTLYPVSGTLAYTQLIEEDGEYHSEWNESYLFGLPLPLRFGLDAGWNVGSGGYRLAGTFEYYSDPYFTSDFFNRAEETGLTRLLGIDSTESDTTEEQEKRNLTWELDGTADFSGFLDTPLVKKLSVKFIKATLLWNSKDNNSVGDYDPARLFYYPVSFKVPNASFEMSGELLTITRPPVRKPAKSQEATTTPTDSQSQLRPPADLEEAAPMAREPGKGAEASRGTLPSTPQQLDLRPPLRQADEPVALAKTPLSFTLNYKMLPNMIVEQSFDSSDWLKPADVAYDLKYTSLESTGSSSLEGTLEVMENMFRIDGDLIYTGKYRTRFRQEFPAGSAWDSLVLADQRYTQMGLKSVLGVDYFPFAGNPVFGNSVLSYDLGWTFYRYLRNETLSTLADPVYSGEAFQWDEQTVSLHSAEAALKWLMWRKESSFSLSAQVPPREVNLAGDLSLRIWLLTTTVNSVFKQEPGGTWDPQPLILKETLDLSENIRLEEELRFNLDPDYLDRSLTSLSLWGFYGSFSAEMMRPKELISGEWQDASTHEQFLPSYVTLGYKQTGEKKYFWKNRLRLQTSLDTSWSMNIEEFTKSSLDFSFTIDLYVHEFLELSFTSHSYNNRTFLYFPGLAKKLDRPWVNPLADLVKSFNIFNLEDRYESNFNLGSISVTAVHHLHDWDLSLTYEGSPVLSEDTSRYEWTNSLSIVLQWIPIPEMRSTMRQEEGIFYLRG